MRTFAYCAKRFENTTRRGAGVWPFTCPPVTAETFIPSMLEGYDLLYFDLHGIPDSPTWYGDDHHAALSAWDVRQAHLDGVVVFAVNCYLADQNSPMMDALLDAGASFVIGGEGQNYGGAKRMLGAASLGHAFRLGLQAGLRTPAALSAAKRWLWLLWAKHRMLGESQREMAIMDALSFKAFYRKGK